MKSNLVDIECTVRRESDLGLGVADGTDETINGEAREKLFWLPKKYAEANDDGTVTMPRWLAEEKGLI